MKKVICLSVLLACSTLVLKADPPLPSNPTITKANQAVQSTDGTNPIAPATLLLLGLAGSFAGVKIYKSNKKEAKSMKKMNLMTALCCLMAVLSVNVFGQSEIKSVEDFLSITSSGNYKQTADLDFTNLSAENAKTLFTRFSSGFSGTYDGCGHKITGLTVTLSDLDGDAGLFGYIKEGTVKNLLIERAEIEITKAYDFNSWSSVYRSVGIIAGKVGGTTTNYDDMTGNVTSYNHYTGFVDSCQILNSKLTVSNCSAAGMIAGAIEGNGEIRHCVANGDVTAEHIAGGIVGKIYTEHGKNEDQDVLYCSFTGNVTANPSMSSDSTITTTYSITMTNNSINQRTYDRLSDTGSMTIDGTTYYYGETTRTVSTNKTMFYACAGGICGSEGNGDSNYATGITQKCTVKVYFTKSGRNYTFVPDKTEVLSCEEKTVTTGSFNTNNVHHMGAEASEANFTGCYSNATVTANGYNGYAAGIINSTGSNGATVGNSYAAGTTTAENTTTVSQSSNTSSTTTNKTNNDDISTDALNSGLADADKFQEVNGEILPGNLCSTATEWETAKEGNYTDASTWKDGKFPANATTNITIKHQVTIPTGKTVTFKNGMTIGLADGGKLIVADGGNLINKTGTALTATMQKNITAGGWNFIGLAMNEDIRAFVGQPAIVALAFNYETGDWATDYLHYYTNDQSGDTVGKGNGILVYTNEGFTLESTGTLVNDDVTVTADVKTNSETQGNWMALANPYPAAMLASNIISGIQTDNSNQLVQGQAVYVRGDNTWTAISSSTEKVDGGHGFFVNFATTGSKTVTMQKSWTQTTTAKSTPAERDFLTVSVSTDGYKVPVMFAKNEAATAEYDIFDANKMFGDGTVAEPYLICNDINLCKEEVNALPYTATMNIKSGEAQSVEIIAENIPEGYSLTLIDNEEEIVMNQGDVYTVNIASGENADRFKLKIGEKNVSITDIETAEALSIRNNNRNIIIEGGKNIKAEVYNTLGQKVYETTKRNFSLEGVEAGAYVVKVQSGNAVQSHKMIIR